MEGLLEMFFGAEVLIAGIWIGTFLILLMFHLLLFREYHSHKESTSATIHQLEQRVNAEIQRSSQLFNGSLTREDLGQGTEEKFLLIQLQLEALKKLEKEKG